MAVKQLASKQEAVENLNELLNASVQRDRFMVAVWDVEEEQLHFRGKICWDFPQGDFLAAAAQLLEDMRREVAEPSEKPAPLRLADLVAKHGARVGPVEERRENLRVAEAASEPPEEQVEPENGEGG